MKVVVEEDIYGILHMRLKDKYDSIKKEIRVVAVEAKYPDIVLRYFDKVAIHPESRLLATVEEDGNVIWLRYYKFKTEEVFKEFLRRVI